MSEIKAVIKQVKVSPKKVRFAVRDIRGLTPLVALSRLKLLQNRSTKVLYKAIKSAVDNGVNNNKVIADTLLFKEIKIDEGRFLKRMRPGARGMGRPYLRRSCHITVILSQKENNLIKPSLGNTEPKVTTTEKKIDIDTSLNKKVAEKKSGKNTKKVDKKSSNI